MSLVSALLPDYVVKDLAASGLAPEDVLARPLESSERAATNTPYSTPGYVLPYFNMNGRLLPFYRVRLFDSDVKYLQPKDSINHVYFPRGFKLDKPFIIITEGEKKAAASVKNGFPCCALSGVDSWRNRTMIVPSSARLSQRQNSLIVRLPSGEMPSEEYDTPIALGLQDLIDTIIAKQLTVIIAFDSDSVLGLHAEVQRAAAQLGYELRFRGIPFHRIRQLILPTVVSLAHTGAKVGLDDFIVHKGSEVLGVAINEVLAARSAFPRHPNVREYINTRLQRAKMTRRESQEVSLAILSDMDAQGMRLRSISTETYYFDYNTKALLKSSWPSSNDMNADSPFTQFMYRRYGLSGSDFRLLMWLGTQFAAEEPIEHVSPSRVITLQNDTIYYQLSDSQFAEVSAQGIKIRTNGECNVLFEAGQVESIDPLALLEAYRQQAATTSHLPCWWATTLAQVRLRDKDKQRIVAALLYYMSPWLLRWRGTQLPIELIVGESGCGKSTLCELRLDILTGHPHLRNTPTDIRDWHASVANAGGLHVTDNVNITDRSLRQKMSDELCRITTEPSPTIEQRKLYTNSEQIRIPIHAVFAVTGIQMPFHNPDLLQRAAILELDKSSDVDGRGIILYDSNWKRHQLEYKGGRTAWVAHHLLVLSRFLALAQKKWNQNYVARQRLVNFEQAMTLMAEVFGIPFTWGSHFLQEAHNQATAEQDWVLEGLHAFACEFSSPKFNQRFTANSICEWCEAQPEYRSNDILTSPRKLGRYMQAHKATIHQITSIREAGLFNNRAAYCFDGRITPKRKPPPQPTPIGDQP